MQRRCKLKMAPWWSTLAFIVLGLMIFDGTGADDNDESIIALLDYLELDLEDKCQERFEVNPDDIDSKIAYESMFGSLTKEQPNELSNQRTSNEDINRKIKLMLYPGDALLDQHDWYKLVNFAETAIHTMQYGKNLDCHKSSQNNCSLTDYLKVISTSRDEMQLAKAKKSWEIKLPDQTYFANEILPLVKNASLKNGHDSVEKYWEMLVEYDGAFEEAKELWEKIEPLYLKLQMYVAKKMKKFYGFIDENNPVPTYLLGSLFGENWSNILDIVSNNPAVYKQLIENLENQRAGGRGAFKLANKALHELNLERLSEKFWRESEFDKTCPIKLLDYCKIDSVKVSSCKDISPSMLLDTFEAAMAVTHINHKFHKRSNTYILRRGNRFSALEEGISGLGSLIAILTQQDGAGVFALKQSESEKYKKDHIITLQLLMALRDLPRLSYYHAADEWRINLLKKSNPITIADSWVQSRNSISHVLSPADEFLGDGNILYNKPYISNFLGIILKYQIFDLLANEDYNKDSSIDLFKKRSSKLRKIMEEGLNKTWPVIMSENFENFALSEKPLLEYFEPLSSFLEEELADNNNNIISDDHSHGVDEFPSVNVEDTDGNKLAYNPSSDFNYDPPAETLVNKIESTTDLNSNPYLIPKTDDGGGEPAASSSDLSKSENTGPGEIDSATLQYAAIGIGVLLLVLVVLFVVVVARKRNKHKKDLERERRQGA